MASRSLASVLKQHDPFSNMEGYSFEDATMVSTTPNCALFMTDNGVYGVKTKLTMYSEQNYLGLDKPNEAKLLSNDTDIIDIAIGGGTGFDIPYFLLLKANGIIKGLGYNESGCLGNGLCENTKTFVRCKLPKNTKAIKIKCGRSFSMVLTKTGDVYCCGSQSVGQCGQTTDYSILYDNMLLNLISNIHKVKDISCGAHHCMALNEGGELYAWGRNTEGQLGVGDFRERTTATPVTLDLDKSNIAQVVCGEMHTLCLTEAGMLFTWGSNIAGQLGYMYIKKNNSCSPKLINIQDEEVIEIAAHYTVNVSAARTMSNIYSWGTASTSSMRPDFKPVVRKVKTLNEIFLQYGVTWKPVTVNNLENKEDQHSLAGNLSETFNNPEYSDVKIIVEDQIIHVNKFMLTARCNHFRTMFASDWKEAESNEIKISDYSHELYEAFLRFLYTDCLEIRTQLAMDLYDLAICYEERHLQKRLEAVIKTGITVENAATLYAMAQKYDSSSLKQHSLNFSMKHLKAVISSDAFMIIDPLVARSLTREVARFPVFKL